MRFWLVFAVFLTLLASKNASACATCAAGDPTLTASGSEKPFEARKRLSLDTRATTARAADVLVREQRLELRADFAPTPTVLLTAALPTIHRAIETFSGARSNEWTLGDAEVRASAVLFDSGISDVRRIVSIFGGVKLPTAPIQNDALGAPLPVALQPGCGSIGPSLGASFVASRAPLTLVASTLFYVPFQVRDGPHAGDSWRTSITVQAQPAHSKVATRFGVSTRLDQAGLQEDQEIDPDSGGFVGYVSGEVLVSPVEDLVVGAGFFAPAVQALEGSQHESTIASLSLSYDF